MAGGSHVFGNKPLAFVVDNPKMLLSELQIFIVEFQSEFKAVDGVYVDFRWI